MSPKLKSTSRSISAEVRLFRLEENCGVLGPGRRAVLWVQGCSLACAGCLVPRSWPAQSGFLRSVEWLADWVEGLPEIEGLTLSGGEPMEQAAALAVFIKKIRERRDLGVVCYTGYRLEELASPSQGELLGQVDLLIDGRYLRAQHDDLLWRGSANQRLIYLTQRYQPAETDRGVGLEFRFEADGRFAFAGVPPWPDFVQTGPFR